MSEAISSLSWPPDCHFDLYLYTMQDAYAVCENIFDSRVKDFIMHYLKIIGLVFEKMVGYA